jgi:hypothetical protein
MKTFLESYKPAHLALELSKMDNETLAQIIVSVLQTREDSAIFEGIVKRLSDRLLLLKSPTDTHPELF